MLIGNVRRVLQELDRIDSSFIRPAAAKTKPEADMTIHVPGEQLALLCRECLDRLIPLSEAHLRSMRKEWAKHFKTARPHMALGPEVPNPPAKVPANEKSCHRLGARVVVCARSVLGGFHHQYSLEPALA